MVRFLDVLMCRVNGSKNRTEDAIADRGGRAMLADQENRYRAAALRPPGAAPAPAFAELCTGCGDCTEICPSGLLYLGPDMLARLRTAKGCGECGLCADVCSHGAIELTPGMRVGLRKILADERRSATSF